MAAIEVVGAGVHGVWGCGGLHKRRGMTRGHLMLRADAGGRAGGRQNATFGNVVELILSIAALTKGLTTVVAMSLLGSVLSNLLLVLGARSTAHRTHAPGGSPPHGLRLVHVFT